MDLLVSMQAKLFMNNNIHKFRLGSSRAAFCVFTVALTIVSNVWAAPQAPAGLTGSVDGNTVSLSWDADSSGEAAGYNVYANNAYIDTVFSQSYSGTIDPNTLVSFTVVAFSSEPLEFSPASNSVELPQNLIPGDLTIPPTVATNLQGSISGSSVSLSWNASTDDEAAFWSLAMKVL